MKYKCPSQQGDSPDGSLHGSPASHEGGAKTPTRWSDSEAQGQEVKGPGDHMGPSGDLNGGQGEPKRSRRESSADSDDMTHLHPFANPFFQVGNTHRYLTLEH